MSPMLRGTRRHSREECLEVLKSKLPPAIGGNKEILLLTISKLEKKKPEKNKSS